MYNQMHKMNNHEYIKNKYSYTKCIYYSTRNHITNIRLPSSYEQKNPPILERYAV